MQCTIHSILLGLLVATPCLADFRCPNSGKLVKTGMSMYEVKLACGDPSFRAISGNVISDLGPNTGTLGPEQWTYDFGSRSFLQYFNFNGGRLRSIVRSDQYGTVKSMKSQKSKE